MEKATHWLETGSGPGAEVPTIPPHDCETCSVCQHFRRGIAAAEDNGDLSLAADGRVLLARHQQVVAEGGPNPWWPVEPVSPI